MDDAIKTARAIIKDRARKIRDTIPPVEAIKEAAMTEQAMTEPTPADVAEVQNPDMVLFAEFTAAEATIKKWNARVEELKAIIRRQEAKFTPEQMAMVRKQVDDWIKKRYPATKVYLAVRQEIDMDGWVPASSGDNVHIHPTIKALVEKKMVGSVNTPSMSELRQSAFNYVAEARDEEGEQILSSFDLEDLKNSLGLVAPQQAVRGKSPGRPANKSANKADGETGNLGKDVQIPGMPQMVKLSYNINTKTYSFRAAASTKVQEFFGFDKAGAKAYAKEHGPSLWPNPQ